MTLHLCLQITARLQKKYFGGGWGIGDRKDGVCLQLHGQVSRQPNLCRYAMLDPKQESSILLSFRFSIPFIKFQIAKSPLVER